MIFGQRKRPIQDQAEIWITALAAWALLGALMAGVMKGERSKVKRRWHELVDRSPHLGETVDVVGPHGEVLEQVATQSEIESLGAEKADTIGEKERSGIRKAILHDALRWSLILLLCVAFGVTAIVVGPFGRNWIQAPNVAAGIMFLIGGTLCASLVAFYSGALELLDHAYSETYGAIQGGLVLVCAMIGAIPAAIFSVGAMWMAHIDSGFALDWSLGWATVYAATGGIHAAICMRLEPDERLSGRGGLSPWAVRGKNQRVSVLVLLAVFLGIPFLLPAAAQFFHLVVRMILRLAGW